MAYTQRSLMWLLMINLLFPLAAGAISSTVGPLLGDPLPAVALAIVLVMLAANIYHFIRHPELRWVFVALSILNVIAFAWWGSLSFLESLPYLPWLIPILWQSMGV